MNIAPLSSGLRILLSTAMLVLSGCGGGGGNVVGLDPQTPTGGTPAWGPRLPSSNLSAIAGAADDFASVSAASLTQAAKAAPLGASQSSRTENGRTVDEFSVSVVRDDDGNLVHEVTDQSRVVLHAPGMRQGADLALFTDLPPGIEPDLSSYPHEVWGLWALDGDVGAFHDTSPSVPMAAFDSKSPTGRAVYEGDAAGLGSLSGTTVKFLADVNMVADFGTRKLSGTIDDFRSFDNAANPFFGTLEVRLLETAFPATASAFSGNTAARDGTMDIPGAGKWGARWTDGSGWTMGGTFGFAADDESIALLGAFGACSCTGMNGGSGDDPVANGNR